MRSGSAKRISRPVVRIGARAGVRPAKRRSTGKALVAKNPGTSAVRDVINAEPVFNDEHQAISAVKPEHVQLITEGLIRPLVEKLARQTLELAEKDRIIEEQARQLRLLPDLNKVSADAEALVEQHKQQAESYKAQIELLRAEIVCAQEEKFALRREMLRVCKQSPEKRKQAPWYARLFGRLTNLD